MRFSSFFSEFYRGKFYRKLVAFQAIKFHHFFEIAEDRSHVSDDNEHFVRKYFNISSTSDEKFSTKLCKKKNFIKNIFLSIGRRQDFTGWGGPSPADPAEISA